MADRTKNIPITGEWTELSVPGAMTDDASYLIDVSPTVPAPQVFIAETDIVGTAPTDGLEGHPLGRPEDNIDSRIYPKKTNVFPWAKTPSGAAVIVISEIAD